MHVARDHLFTALKKYRSDKNMLKYVLSIIYFRSTDVIVNIMNIHHDVIMLYVKNISKNIMNIINVSVDRNTVEHVDIK